MIVCGPVGAALVFAAMSCGLVVTGTSFGEDAAVVSNDTSSSESSAESSPDGRARDDQDQRDTGSEADPLPDAADAFLCGEASVTTCVGCEAGAIACQGTKTCVSDCFLECDAGTLGCAACSNGVAAGACEPQTSASCLQDMTYDHCGCIVAADCPGANQVCVLGTCRTCGEEQTKDEVCRDGTGGRKCKADDADLARRFRCR